MSDYNTDEEEFEKLKQWWADNRMLVISGLVVGGGLLFGYNKYEAMTTERAQAASSIYEEVKANVAAKDVSSAEQNVARLSKDFSATPYDAQAQLALAKMHVEAGDADAGMAALRAAMDQGNEELKHVARLRLARLQIGAGQAEDAQKTLAVVNEGEFTSLYQEVRGDAYAAAGNNEQAIAQYKLALNHDIPLVDTAYVEIKLKSLGGAMDEAQLETVNN